MADTRRMEEQIRELRKENYKLKNERQEFKFQAEKYKKLYEEIIESQSNRAE